MTAMEHAVSTKAAAKVKAAKGKKHQQQQQDAAAPSAAPPGAAAVGKCTLGQQYSRADEKKDPESDLHGALSGFSCNSFSRQNVDCKKLTSAMTLGPLCNFLLVFDSTSVFILAPS